MSYFQWPEGRPPKTWPRLLAVDVGGSTPWAWIWSAIDPWHNVVVYHELYKTTDSAQMLIDEAMPWMKDEDGQEYQWKAKIIDYENKIAAEDLRRGGITMTNAQKHDKASSIERLKGYIHPNPKHHFPEWHTRVGQPNSPRFFVLPACKNVRREIPQARWLEVNGVTKNEMDRRTGNHTIDCLLYTIRELPPPMALAATPPMYGVKTKNLSKISEIYHYEAMKREEELARQAQSNRRGKPVAQVPLFGY